MYVGYVAEMSFLVLAVYALFMFMSMKIESEDNMMSSYECGFDLMMSSRIMFSYRFFLISILFLVFDVEISLLLPLPFVVLGPIEMTMVVLFMMIFLFGLVYEYYNGILLWAE